MIRENLMGTLRTLPQLRPDPAWKERAKRRLLIAYEHWYQPLRRFRHWAVYVSAESDPTAVADAIVARGQDWRPLAVRPERVTAAVAAIQPALVVVDSRLPECERVVDEVKHCTAAAVVTRDELVAVG